MDFSGSTPQQARKCGLGVEGEAGRGMKWAGTADYVHLFPTLSSVHSEHHHGSLKWAMVGVLTPQKLPRRYKPGLPPTPPSQRTRLPALCRSTTHLPELIDPEPSPSLAAATSCHFPISRLCTFLQPGQNRGGLDKGRDLNWVMLSPHGACLSPLPQPVCPLMAFSPRAWWCLLKGSLELRIALLLSGSQQAVGQSDQVQPLRVKGYQPEGGHLPGG